MLGYITLMASNHETAFERWFHVLFKAVMLPAVVILLVPMALGYALISRRTFADVYGEAFRNFREH